MIIPDYSTLKQWAASLVEDFEEDNIPEDMRVGSRYL